SSCTAYNMLLSFPTRRPPGLGGVAYLILNLFAHVLGDLLGAKNAKFFERDPADPHFRPGDDFRIAVLAQHVSVDMMRIHAEVTRSEEHTSELQSRENLVCRLL